jgi:hypothetical protein
VSGSGHTREQIAQAGAAVRISDPAGTVLHDGEGNHYVSLKTMREIADAILALPPLSAASELVRALKLARYCMEVSQQRFQADGRSTYLLDDGIEKADAALKALPCGGGFSSVGREERPSSSLANEPATNREVVE